MVKVWPIQKLIDRKQKLDEYIDFTMDIIGIKLILGCMAEL